MQKFTFRIVNPLLIISVLLLGIGVGMAQTTAWTLVWDKNPESDMYFYEVFREVDGQGFEKIAEVYHPTVEYRDNSIQAGKLYRYRVRAVDATYNKSDYSSTISGAIPLVSGLPRSLRLPSDTTVTFQLDNYVYDPDHNDDQLTWNASGNSALDVQVDAATRQLTIRTPSNWQGSEKITLIVTDPDGWQGRWEIQVSDQGVTNQPPQLADIPDQTIAEGGQFAQIDLNRYVDDPNDADHTLQWEASGYRQLQVQINDQNIATISVPHADWYGQERVTFTVRDPSGESDQDDVVFTVTPVNDAPVISPIPDQTVEAGKRFRPIVLDNYVEDVDNADAELTWTVSGAQQLKATISTDRVLTVAPKDARWSGSETLTLRVTDPAGASAETQVTFTMLAVDNANFYSTLSFSPDVNNNRLRIEWQTAAPTIDVLHFGIVPEFAQQLTVDSALSTAHSVVLTNLTPNVEYNFQITSRTENGAAYQSEVFYYTLSNVQEVNVYPIPYVADENQSNPYIFFTNLPSGGTLIIYNLLGEPVFSYPVEGNAYAWDVRNAFGEDVQPGLYIYVVKDENQKKIASGKLIVVR